MPEITIRDIIPLSDDKRIKVLLRKPDGLSTAKDRHVVDLKEVRDGLKVRWSSLVDTKGGEKEGRFEFLTKVEAGEKVEVKSSWEITSPADLTWHETSPSTALFG